MLHLCVSQYHTSDIIMYTLKRAGYISMLLLYTTMASAGCNNCCDSLGGIQYCDSSASRYVCKNGDYSTCYCTRHAVMDLQKIAGCCLWQGGVLKISETKMVICNNGSISEICGLQIQKDSASMF